MVTSGMGGGLTGTGEISEEEHDLCDAEKRRGGRIAIVGLVGLVLSLILSTMADENYITEDAEAREALVK